MIQHLDRRPLVYLAGVGWDEVAGTDKRLAHAIAGHGCPVLWVDPPVSVKRWALIGQRRTPLGADVVENGILRLRIAAPPGFTKPAVRPIAFLSAHQVVQRLLRRTGCRPRAVLLSSPLDWFPSRLDAPRVLYLTDDWVAGAPLMNLNALSVARNVQRNISRADLTAAVSPALLRSGNVPESTKTMVLPNGCQPQSSDVVDGTPSQIEGSAVLIGQLNERIDPDLIMAVAMRGIRIDVVGPRTDRDPPFGRKLDVLLNSPGVVWHGPKMPGQVPDYLRKATIGLTPYRSSAFNDASFPLKTLEYLSAGLPVVSTDLPSVTWIKCSDIHVASSPEAFANVAETLIRAPQSVNREERRRRAQFAAGHSWSRRAAELLGEIETLTKSRPGTPHPTGVARW